MNMGDMCSRLWCGVVANLGDRVLIKIVSSNSIMPRVCELMSTIANSHACYIFIVIFFLLLFLFYNELKQTHAILFMNLILYLFLCNWWIIDC